MNRAFLLIAICCLTGSAVAQTYDLRSWLGGEMDYRLNKRFSLGLEQQVRLEDNMVSFDASISEITGSYKLYKGLRLRAGYRLTLDQAGHEHRFQGGVRYKETWKDLSLYYRFRYQIEDTYFLQPVQEFRHRVKLSWHASKKHDPYILVEAFDDLRSDRPGWNKLRYGIGNGFDVGKRKVLNVYLLHQRELNEFLPQVDYILGLSYEFSMKGKKKSKKD